MHELSIAQAILEQVHRYTPQDAILRSVAVRAGPMRGIDAMAMQCAWEAATTGTAWEQARLELELRQWHLSCPHCGREWDTDDRMTPCTCGCDETEALHADELVLLSLEIDDIGEEVSVPEEVERQEAAGVRRQEA